MSSLDQSTPSTVVPIDHGSRDSTPTSGPVRFAAVISKDENLDSMSWPVRIHFRTEEEMVRFIDMRKAQASRRFLKVADYADHRRFSKRTVENLIRLGMPISGHGKLRRVEVAVADAWVAENAGLDPIDREARRAARKAATKIVAPTQGSST